MKPIEPTHEPAATPAAEPPAKLYRLRQGAAQDPEVTKPWPVLIDDRYKHRSDSEHARHHGPMDLLGVPQSAEMEVKIAPHEMAVVRWLREQLERTSSPGQAHHVGVLLVGEANVTSVVNEQLDHTQSAGIESIVHGKTLAQGDYCPLGMADNSEYVKGWQIMTNGLGNNCRAFTWEEIGTRTLKDDELREAMRYEADAPHGLGTIAQAEQMFALFPGHTFELIGAMFHVRGYARTIAAARQFFADHGELELAHFDVTDALGSCVTGDNTGDLLAALLKRKGGTAWDVLKSALQAALAAESEVQS